MFWKAILITTFAIGALAEYQITGDQWNQLQVMVKLFCKENGAEDKADEVQTAIINYMECMSGIIDHDTLVKVIQPNGALGEVAKKYCAKSPQLKTCTHTMTTGVSPCLGINMRDNILWFANVGNAIDQLIDFMCYKDGDRIAQFIAEDGPKCFQEKDNTIRECTTTVGQGINSVVDAKKLTIDEQCAKFDELTACIVSALEECSTPAPSSMAVSLFRSMRHSSPCPKKD